MTLPTKCFVVLLVLAAASDVACGRGDAPWDGAYFGVNAGEASGSSCNSWALNGATIDAAMASEFNSRNCSKSSGLVAGVQFGENFQYKRLVVGVDADIEHWSSKSFNQSLKSPG